MAADSAKVPRNPQPGIQDRRLALLPFVVAATFFMEYLDTTIITTALPQMARSFEVGPNEVSLGLTAYMLTLAVCIPVSGWIADRFGSRSVFLAAIVTFTLASILCGASASLSWFVVARVLQGIGGAMMVPVGRLIVVRNTPKAGMMRALSTITWPGIIAPVIGPTLGGFITTYWSWRWSFFVNVPFGLLVVVATLLVAPNQKSGERRGLDLRGFVLSGIALISLLYGTEIASHTESSALVAAGLVLFGLMVGVIAIRHLLRAAEPLVDLTTMRVHTFAVTVSWGSMTRASVEAVPYLLPLMFQIGFGLSAFHSGLFLLAAALGNFGMKMFTTPVLRFFGFRSVAAYNGALASIVIMSCAFLGATTPVAVTAGLLFCYGLSRSMQFTTLATLAYADVNERQKGSASTLWSAAQQMTIGMGVALGALCLRISSALHGRAAGQSFVVGDFRFGFVTAGALVLLSTIGYFRLPANAGSAIGGGAARRSRQV
jgi:EmrB/QacA subfamily drug resistance transporter